MKPGLSAEGYVEVEPIGGDLEAGDLVVVGIEQGASPQGPEPAADASPQPAASQP